MISQLAFVILSLFIAGSSFAEGQVSLKIKLLCDHYKSDSEFQKCAKAVLKSEGK